MRRYRPYNVLHSVLLLGSWVAFLWVWTHAWSVPNYEASVNWIGALIATPIYAFVTTMRSARIRAAHKQVRTLSRNREASPIQLPFASDEVWTPPLVGQTFTVPKTIEKRDGTEHLTLLQFSAIGFAVSVWSRATALFAGAMLVTFMLTLVSWIRGSSSPRAEIVHEGIRVRGFPVATMVPWDDVSMVELGPNSLTLHRHSTTPLVLQNALPSHTAYLLQRLAETETRRPVPRVVSESGIISLVTGLLRRLPNCPSIVVGWRSAFSQLRVLVHPNGGLACVGASTQLLLSLRARLDRPTSALLLAALHPWLSTQDRSALQLDPLPTHATVVEQAMHTIVAAVANNNDEAIASALDILEHASTRVKVRTWEKMIPSFTLHRDAWGTAMEKISREDLFEAGLPHDESSMTALITEQTTPTPERLIVIALALRWFDGPRLRDSLLATESSFPTQGIAALVRAMDRRDLPLVRKAIRAAVVRSTYESPSNDSIEQSEEDSFVDAVKSKESQS